MLVKKLLFVLIPKPWFYTLLIGVVFLFFNEEYQILGYIAVNASLFKFSIGASIIVHEFGHWLGARMIGEYPHRVVLGKGHLVQRAQFFDTKIMIYHQLQTGHIITLFSNHKNYRLRRIFYVLAGPLANLAVGLFFYFTFPLSTHFGQEIVVGISFGIFNILVFVVNLYPREESINGIKFNSDGLHIKKALMGEYKEAVDDELVLSNLLDGEDFFQQKSYDKALALYQSNLNKLNESSELTSYAVRINIAICKGRLGDTDHYFEELKEVEKSLGEERFKVLEGPVYNNLAWLYLLNEQVEEATNYSKMAYLNNASRDEVRATWGAILIENGEYENGIDILKPLANLSYSNNTTLTAAMYLAFGYDRLGKDNLKKKYWEFVKEHEGDFEFDDKKLYKRLSDKLNLSIIASDTTVNLSR